MFRFRQILVLMQVLTLLHTVIVSKLFAASVGSGSPESVDCPVNRCTALLNSSHSNEVLESVEEGMDEAAQAVKRLTSFLSENYNREFHDGQDVRSFFVSSQSIEIDQPWLNTILDEPESKLAHHAVMLDNSGGLGSVETIRLFEYINSAIEQDLLQDRAARKLKMLFEQTDVLVLNLYFNHWPMDQLCYNLSLEAIEKFISFFPNVKKMYLGLDYLTGAFRLPIPSNIQNLEVIYIRLIEGCKNIPREEDTHNWYRNWPSDLLNVIKNNIHLRKLYLYAPLTKKYFLEELKDVIKKCSDFSDLALFNPKREERFSDSFNYCEDDAVYLEMYKNILAENPHLSEIRCFKGMHFSTPLNQADLDQMIKKNPNRSMNNPLNLESERSIFWSKIKLLWPFHRYKKGSPFRISGE